MRGDIEPGATFPDYELADHAGKRRRLSELQGGNAMVLHLSRGGYDPKEHRFLRHLVDAYADFKVAYTRVVVISTDDQLNTNEFRDALGAEWPFLSDPEWLNSAGSGHQGVYGPPRSDDPAHLRAGAWSAHIPHL